VLRWIFLDDEKCIRFIRLLQRGVYPTIVIQDNPIIALLHYNLESIIAVSLIVRLLN
jgi:hypothetical protein